MYIYIFKVCKVPPTILDFLGVYSLASEMTSCVSTNTVIEWQSENTFEYRMRQGTIPN